MDRKALRLRRATSRSRSEHNPSGTSIRFITSSGDRHLTRRSRTTWNSWATARRSISGTKCSDATATSIKTRTLRLALVSSNSGSVTSEAIAEGKRHAADIVELVGSRHRRRVAGQQLVARDLVGVPIVDPNIDMLE